MSRERTVMRPTMERSDEHGQMNEARFAIFDQKIVSKRPQAKEITEYKNISL